MKNTRITAWMLISILLIGICAIPAGAEGEIKPLSIVAIEGETIWIHADAGLVPFSKDGEAIGGAMYPGADAYAIGPDGHIFYSIGGDIYEVDREGNEIDQWHTPIDNFKKLLVNDTYIILMGDEEYGAIDKAAHIMASGVVSGVKDIGFYNDDSFLLLQEMDMASLLVQLDCSNAEDVELAQIYIEGKIAYSSETEGFYLYNENQIYHMESFEEAEYNYMTLPVEEHILDMYIGQDAVYVITASGLKSYARKSENAESKVLTIYNGRAYDIDDRLAKATEIFIQRHPEYAVKLTAGVGMEKLNTALMANDPGYEIMILALTRAEEYKKSGILAELSGNEIISENIAQWMEMPFLHESDGNLYGLPISIMPYGFTISKALYNEIGMELDRNWTWDDFYALVDVARELGLKITNGDNAWTAIMRQYQSAYCDYYAGESNYDTETFRRLVTMWKELADEGMLSDPFKNEAVLLEFHIMPVIMNAEMWKESLYLGMPTLDGECVTPIEMEALYVNAQSEHKDAAMEYMEIYSSPEVQLENYNPEMLPDLEKHTNYIWWERFGEVPTQEQMELWQHYMKSGKLCAHSDEFGVVVVDLIADLVADRLTVDEFIAEMQERADLMVGE